MFTENNQYIRYGKVRNMVDYSVVRIRYEYGELYFTISSDHQVFIHRDNIDPCGVDNAFIMRDTDYHSLSVYWFNRYDIIHRMREP